MRWAWAHFSRQLIRGPQRTPKWNGPARPSSRYNQSKKKLNKTLSLLTWSSAKNQSSAATRTTEIGRAAAAGGMIRWVTNPSRFNRWSPFIANKCKNQVASWQDAKATGLFTDRVSNKTEDVQESIHEKKTSQTNKKNEFPVLDWKLFFGECDRVFVVVVVVTRFLFFSLDGFVFKMGVVRCLRSAQDGSPRRPGAESPCRRRKNAITEKRKNKKKHRKIPTRVIRPLPDRRITAHHRE